MSTPAQTRPSGRQLPRSGEAEEAVIGGVLFAGRALSSVSDLLVPEDFYDMRHECIFAAMLAIDTRGQPVDLVTVDEEMRRAGTMARLQASGGAAYLSDLSNRVATAANIEHHARIVRAASIKRRLIAVAEGVIADGLDPEVEATEQLERAQRAVFEVATRSSARGAKSLHQVLQQSLAALEHRFRNRQAVTGIPTGFAELDELTTGLQPQNLVIVAARPSMGKTAFAMACAQHAALDRRIPAYVFSLEMAEQELGDRVLASEGRVDAQALRTGYLETAHWARLGKCVPRMADAPMWIDENPAPTLMDVRTRVRRWRADPKVFAGGDRAPGLVVLDYLQLVSPSAGRNKREQTREREISEISRGLKQLAKETGCTVLALSQLNRSLEARADKRPMLSDLRESGAIEQDADLVLFIYRDEVYNANTDAKGVAEILIGKQRNGPTGCARLAFLREYTRFENLSHRSP
jgi:replicative DNA helicase